MRGNRYIPCGNRRGSVLVAYGAEAFLLCAIMLVAVEFAQLMWKQTAVNTIAQKVSREAITGRRGPGFNSRAVYLRRGVAEPMAATMGLDNIRVRFRTPRNADDAEPGNPAETITITAETRVRLTPISATFARLFNHYGNYVLSSQVVVTNEPSFV